MLSVSSPEKKVLERIGDHAVNVAEWVEFSITGEHLSDEMREK